MQVQAIEQGARNLALIAHHLRLGAHLPVILVFACTALLLHALPIVALVIRSLRDGDGRFTLVNYAHLFAPPAAARLNGSVIDATVLSLCIALVATAIAMLLGVLVALVASRRPRSRSRRPA